MRWCLFSLSSPNKRIRMPWAPAECLQDRYNREEMKEWCNTCSQQQYPASIATSWVKELHQASHNSQLHNKSWHSRCPATKNFSIKLAISYPASTATGNCQTIITKTPILLLQWLVEVGKKALSKNRSSLGVAKQPVSRLRPEQLQAKDTSIQRLRAILTGTGESITCWAPIIRAETSRMLPEIKIKVSQGSARTLRR